MSRFDYSFCQDQISVQQITIIMTLTLKQLQAKKEG